MIPTNILIVEDERIIAKGIEKRLKGLGYAVAGSASNGEEAIAKAVELRPDMILMDINLGSGMDGVTAAGAIRTRIDAPVIFLTAFSDDTTLQRAKLTEPYGYVLKPYEDKDLQTAIEIGPYKHKMDRRLQENEQWLAATLGSIGDGVIAIDEAGRVRFMNALAEQLTGWTQSDALGLDVRTVFQIVDGRNRQPVDNPALIALHTGRSASLAPDTLLIDRVGMEIPVDDSAAPIRDVNGRVSGAVLVFRDITERRRLEEHLRQSQKMEAIGRLAGGIAHDFNNIMTIITGYSEMLLADERLDANQQEGLAAIHEAGERAAALTNQIMAFSRKQMLISSVLDLNSIVRDIFGMVKRLIGSNITFVAEPAPDLGRVEADPTQIGQVILNLAVNARDAMPDGGRLAIATRNVELDEETTRLHPDVPAGKYVELSLTDNGCGMSDEVRLQIFEPFFTTKAVGKGTGLGLATVYGIVKQSGGHIEVASEIGVGTTFRVYLPQIADAPSLQNEARTKATAKGRETILLVEDDDTVRRMTRTVLRQCGYTVLEAANGKDGVAIAERHVGPIHLLLTDLVMPEMPGREVAERLTASNRVERVLFMSGYTDDVLMQQGIESAKVDFIRKPFGIEALAKIVREVLSRPAQ